MDSLGASKEADLKATSVATAPLKPHGSIFLSPLAQPSRGRIKVAMKCHLLTAIPRKVSIK